VALHESAGIIAVALCWRGVVRLPAEARGPWRLIAVAIAGFAVLDVGYAVFSTSAHDTFGTTERTGRAFRCADRRGSSGSNATRGAAMTDRTSANDLEDHRPRQISELLGGGRTVAMVMTMVGDHHSSRPVTCVEVTDTRLSFLLSLEVDWVTVSPKAGARLVLDRGDELKLVYPQAGIEPEEFRHLQFTHFYLQPMDGPQREQHTQAAVAWCLAHPRWRLSLQTHKLLGIP
jgi:hypothetical protein